MSEINGINTEGLLELIFILHPEKTKLNQQASFILTLDLFIIDLFILIQDLCSELMFISLQAR